MTDLLINELKIFAKSLSVLIVEDDAALREELDGFISCFFYKTVTAENGLKALELYKKDRFDIVITDLRMPDMNGMELAKEIKTLNKNQIVMVLSGYIDEFVIELIDIGIDTLLLKPYKFEVLLQKLLKHSENIILKKDFEKLVVSKSLTKVSKKETSPEKSFSNNKILSVDTLADEVTNSKVGDDFIENFKLTHVKSDDIDKNMWRYISEEIESLNFEFEEITNLILLNGIDTEIIKNLGRIFNKYYQNLSLITELNSFAKIFIDLADTFHHFDISTINQDEHEIFDVFEYFYEDLNKFFYVVFIENQVENINYLTDSLKSSVIQIKVKLKVMELEEDELELF